MPYHCKRAHSLPVATVFRIHQEQATSTPDASAGTRDRSNHSRTVTEIATTTGILERPSSLQGRLTENPKPRRRTKFGR